MAHLLKSDVSNLILSKNSTYLWEQASGIVHAMTLIILLITVGISIWAFSNQQVLERFLLKPYMIKQHNQYERFLTSGLIHGDWIHLLVNMFVFLSFGSVVEDAYRQIFGGFGILNFLLLYIGALVFADVATFFKHQHDPAYSSLGASGAVSAVVFASIIFEPWRELLLFAIIPIPGIIAGALYLAFSAYMARNSQGHINHDAHFYGALFGVVFTILLKPELGLAFLRKLGL